MRLIDADAIEKFIVDGLNNPDKAKAFGHDAIEILAEVHYAPTIDAAPAVLCKDCKHYWKNVNTFGYSGVCTTVSDDDFCSYGERGDG